MQLNLFQWDLVEICNAYRCLATFQFERAEARFCRVLEALPAHGCARAGLEQCRYWQTCLAHCEQMPLPMGVMQLWQTITHAAFEQNEYGQSLRKALLDRLLRRMEAAELEFLPPDLSTGYLTLLLGDNRAAEIRLRRQLTSFPGHGILYGYLADTLWQQGRHEPANALYATALLTAPERMRDHPLCNPNLASLVVQHGPELALVYGFFEGLVPLVEPEHPPDSEAGCIHSLLRQAELARHRHDHEAMIGARQSLQQRVPQVFRDYLLWLAASPEADSGLARYKKKARNQA